MKFVKKTLIVHRIATKLENKVGGYSATHKVSPKHTARLMLGDIACTTSVVGPGNWPVARGHHYEYFCHGYPANFNYFNCHYC